MKMFYASSRNTGNATARRHFRWRNWRPMLWLIATLTSPTIWMIILMLHSDARCDQPLFWWGLGPALALSHGLAILQWQPASCYTRRHASLAYLGVALPATILLVLMLAWSTGFLRDMLPLAEQWSGHAETWLSLGCCFAVIVVFALLSHLVSALALPCLAFRAAIPRRPAPG
jgi:hypothetical protein